MSSPSDATDAPEGLGPQHIERHRKMFHRHANVTSLVVLAGILAWGLSGAAGSRTAWHAATAPGASLQVGLPPTVRNGETFEAVVRVQARQPLKALGIGLAPGLIRDVTVNSTVPTAESEDFHQNQFRFQFGALPAGEAFEWKVALQLNPGLVGTNAGPVQLLDGDTVVASLPLQIKVLP